MPAIPQGAVDAVASIFREEAIFDPHGWRCAYPDPYGPCTCEADYTRDALVRLRAAIHADGPEGDAVREALGLRWVWLDEYSRRVVGDWQEAP